MPHRVRDTRAAPLLNERYRFRNARTRGAVAVDLVGVVGKSERNAAYHAAVGGEAKMPADHAGMPCQCCLGNGAEAERLGGKHEITDIGAAIDRAVDTQRLVGVDDGDMRRAEEIVVLQRLSGIGRLVAARNSECVVELKTALAAA